MTNNVVPIIIILTLTSFLLPSYASARSGSSNSSSNSNQDGQYSNLDSTMEIVAVVLVCVFLLIGFMSFFFSHCSEEAPTARIARLGAAPGGRGLDPAVIDSFPVLAYISVKELKSGKVSGELECAVCLSEFEELDSLKLLRKCNHVFHPECIDAWLASHVTCPVCRANLEFKLESNLEKQQPPASISVVVNSENRQEEEQEKDDRRQILGKLMRSHSLFDMEKYSLGLLEEGRVSMSDDKECIRRCSSY